jgi:transposase
MSTTAKNPEITPIPVQLSEHEFTAFICPPLSMPKRGPTCKIGYHRLFHLILWGLYTGMPWTCLPMLQDAHGKPELHDTNVYRAFATWAGAGSLQQAFMASVAHLSDEKKLDLRVLHGDGTNTRAKKGGMASGMRATNISKARRSSPSPTTWLGLVATPRGSRQGDGHDPAPRGAERLEAHGSNGGVRPRRSLFASRRWR